MSFKDALKGLKADFGAPEAPPAASNGPAPIALALIEPDPDQPRKLFDQGKLDELADSMRENQLQQPIGLRPHPTKAGHYMIRFGERRYRAALQLGWTEIDAIVAEGGSVAVQALIENIQRDDLTALEVADALEAAREAMGLKKGELAKKLGKPLSWVSTHLALRDMPEEFREGLRTGSVSDHFTLYEAYTLSKTHGPEVRRLLADATLDNPVTRDSVRQLANQLKGDTASGKGGKAGQGEATSSASAGTSKPAQKPGPRPSTLPQVFVTDGSEIGYLNLTRPAPEGKVYVVRGEDEALEKMADLKLIRIELPA